MTPDQANVTALLAHASVSPRLRTIAEQWLAIDREFSRYVAQLKSRVSSNATNVRPGRKTDELIEAWTDDQLLSEACQAFALGRLPESDVVAALERSTASKVEMMS